MLCIVMYVFVKVGTVIFKKKVIDFVLDSKRNKTNGFCDLSVEKHMPGSFVNCTKDTRYRKPRVVSKHEQSFRKLATES